MTDEPLEGDVIPYEDTRKRGPGRKFVDFPAQSTPEEIKDYKISTMADAMELARQKVRHVGDDDPDPYGYVQELENDMDMDLLEPQWKAKPDDQQWVKRIKGRARKAKVAQLFLAGHKPLAIAQMLEVSEVTICHDINNLGMEWRRAYIGDIEILAGKDLERLESYLVALQPGIERGDFKSIATALEIIKERGSILGYRQGVQVDIEQYVREVAEANGFDPEKAVQMAQRISVSFKG